MWNRNSPRGILLYKMIQCTSHSHLYEEWVCLKVNFGLLSGWTEVLEAERTHLIHLQFKSTWVPLCLWHYKATLQQAGGVVRRKRDKGLIALPSSPCTPRWRPRETVSKSSAGRSADAPLLHSAFQPHPLRTLIWACPKTQKGMKQTAPTSL